MRYSHYLLCLLWLFSCTESEVEPDTDRLGLQYFPLEVGDFRVYDVVETKYTVLGETTELYELKESVVDSGLNAGNNLEYTIHRSTRLDATVSWKLDSVWTARINNNFAVLVENNVALMKLVFPIQHDSTWNGNTLNILGNDDYRYDTEVQDTVLNENELSQLVRVIQNDAFEDILGFTEQSEHYAPEIGLVLKESTILNYCTETVDGATQLCDGIVQIEAGRKIVMTLNEYGKE